MKSSNILVRITVFMIMLKIKMRRIILLCYHVISEKLHERNPKNIHLLFVLSIRVHLLLFLICGLT